jgi:hypothetical protein
VVCEYGMRFHGTAPVFQLNKHVQLQLCVRLGA